MDIYLGNSVVGDSVTEFSESCRFKGFTPPPPSAFDQKISAFDQKIVDGAFQVSAFVDAMKAESLKGEQNQPDQSFFGRVTKYFKAGVFS